MYKGGGDGIRSFLPIKHDQPPMGWHASSQQGVVLTGVPTTETCPPQREHTLNTVFLDLIFLDFIFTFLETK